MASKDFFLSPDEAETMGNINFMRKSVQVRHTFPKNLKNPNGFEITKNVSSLGDNSVSNIPISNQNSSSTNTPSSTFSSNDASNRQFNTSASSNSMDLFRNMARNIGKR